MADVLLAQNLEGELFSTSATWLGERKKKAATLASLKTDILQESHLYFGLKANILREILAQINCSHLPD